MAHEDLLKPGETLRRMDCTGWIVPRNLLPIGCDIVVDWPQRWGDDNSSVSGEPFRCTVDYHFSNGVIRCTYPTNWPPQKGRETINLGDDTWWSIWIVDLAQ